MQPVFLFEDNCFWLSLWRNDLLGNSWQVSPLKEPQSLKQYISVRQHTEMGQKIDIHRYCSYLVLFAHE